MLVLKEFMESIDFRQSAADPCIFVKSTGADITIVAVYVDDLVIVMNTKETMRMIKESLAKRFKMKDLGELHYCLGINVEFDEEKKCLKMHQKQYIQLLLERYGLLQAKVASTP